jgi:hypothetical protein
VKESNVLAIGGSLVCVAVLMLAAIAPVFRSSDPPRWATRGWVGEIFTLAIVCTLAIGVGYLGAGAIDTFQTGPDYLDLGLLASGVFLSVLIWRRLSAHPRAFASRPSLHTPNQVSGGARGGGPVATAEPVSVSAIQPPPRHKAA